MRIALDATGDIGSRAAKVLLGERHLTALGLVGRRVASHDRRVRTIRDLDGWDVYVSDDLDGMRRQAARAGRARIPLVVYGDDPDALGEPLEIPILIGANSRGLAAVLAAHECARHDNPLEVVVGWTEPKRPHRRGHPLTFPQPVGNAWGHDGPVIWPDAPAGTRFLSAGIETAWMGLMAKVTAATPDGVEARTLGVADDAAYLAGIALAAGALAAAAGAYPVGVHYPTAAPDAYLDAALDAGLEVATFSERLRGGASGRE